MAGSATVQNVAQSAGIARLLPREVLERHRKPLEPVGKGWYEFLGSLISKVDDADVGAENLRHRKWLTCLQYHAGEQGGFVGLEGNWVNLPVNPWDSEYDPANSIYVVNFVRYFVRSLLKDYSRSQVTVDVKTASTRFEKRMAAQVGRALARHVQQQQLSPYKMLRDAKFTIICGNSFRYTICDATSGGYHKEPVMERVKINIGAGWRCSQCYQMGNAPEFGGAGGGIGDAVNSGALPVEELQQACPDCGGQMVYAGGGETEIERPSGQFEMKARPDIQTVIVDPFEMKLPLSSSDLYVAPWLRRQRYVEKTRLELAYSWAAISGGSGDGDAALNAQRQRQTSAGNIGGAVNGMGGMPEHYERFRQYWFRPEEYAHYIFETNETMADGEVVKAGTRAVELFPKGLYVAVAGGAIVDLADEDKARHWTQNRWEIEPSSPWASGIEDMVVNNATRNEAFSLLMESMAYHTAPPVMLDGQIWDRDDWTGKPGQVAVTNRVLAQGRDLASTYSIPPSRSVGGDVWNFLEASKADMQMTSGGAFSTTAGLPDVHTETAEGMAIQRDESLSFFGPQFSAKAETDVQTVKQAVSLVKEYGLAGDYFRRLSDLSEMEIRQFEEADIDLDFIFEQRRGSEIPRTALEMKNAWTEAMGLGLYTNPSIPAVLRRQMFDALGLPYGTELFGADERNTQLSIAALRELAEKLEAPLGADAQQMLNDPAAMQVLMQTALPLAMEMAPVRARFDDHAVAMEVITEFMKTDDGRGLSSLGQTLINDLYERHLMGTQAQMAEQAMLLGGMPGMGAEGMQGQDGGNAPKPTKDSSRASEPSGLGMTA